MRRSKHQAIYKYLPGMWISDNSDGGKITAIIKNWVWRDMGNIYEHFIIDEIKRQIRFFEARGGDVTSFDLSPEKKTFRIVEVAELPGVPDIRGEISPLVFYCSSCGDAFSLGNAKEVEKSTWKCRTCNKYSIKQLQMVYTCECGHAEPIKIPYVKGVNRFKYRPTETSYKMFYREGKAERAAEFSLICPTCKYRIAPDNATANRNFRPFPLRIINLLDEKSGKFYEKGLDAQKVVVARWFNLVKAEAYERILDNVELVFSDEYRIDARRKEVERQVRSLVEKKMIDESQFDIFVNQLLGTSSDDRGIDSYVAACDNLFSKQKSENVDQYNKWINNLSFKLMQYDTLKNVKNKISLEASISKQCEMELIDDPNEIYSISERMGIENMQVSCDVQIVNCIYGFSRRSKDPHRKMNHNCRLKLNSFGMDKDGKATLVYGAKLDTEGVLFEISQKRIIEWLFQNSIIKEEQLPDLEDDISVKKWFAECVHAESITMYGDLNEVDPITQNVFSLLHSISHAFLKTAGELSGISSNSLMEIIIVETASIFIYAQSGQGLTLGSLSGMIEMNYIGFLKSALSDARNCVFDPICTGRDDTACSACMIIPEVSCNYFNSNLGRKYMYTIPGVNVVKTGFWEMDNGENVSR